MSEKKIIIQRIWGCVLLFTAVAMFISIPEKMSGVQASGGYSQGQTMFLQISFYIISIILFIGGAKKLWMYLRITSDMEKETDK